MAASLPCLPLVKEREAGIRGRLLGLGFQWTLLRGPTAQPEATPVLSSTPRPTSGDIKALCSFTKDELMPAGAGAPVQEPTCCPDVTSPSRILSFWAGHKELREFGSEPDHQHGTAFGSGNVFPSRRVSTRLWSTD